MLEFSSAQVKNIGRKNSQDERATNTRESVDFLAAWSGTVRSFRRYLSRAAEEKVENWLTAICIEAQNIAYDLLSLFDFS